MYLNLSQQKYTDLNIVIVCLSDIEIYILCVSSASLCIEM